MSARSNALADRLEQGAQALAGLVNELPDQAWQTRLPKDGRKIGVVVHHVANMYPIELQLAQALASGQPIAGVSWDDVHAINAAHDRQPEMGLLLITHYQRILNYVKPDFVHPHETSGELGPQHGLERRP